MHPAGIKYDIVASSAAAGRQAQRHACSTGSIVRGVGRHTPLSRNRRSAPVIAVRSVENLVLVRHAVLQGVDRRFDRRRSNRYVKSCYCFAHRQNCVCVCDFLFSRFFLDVARYRFVIIFARSSPENGTVLNSEFQNDSVQRY